ncbi:MAG TPA: hypothetical protein VJM33_08365 [Microthrixaceae bacterium]|nr:hypothetical protein [Microthrixaceae bacterium]
MQLVGLGAFVGGLASERPSVRWAYAGATALFGVAAVGIKLVLGH